MAHPEGGWIFKSVDYVCFSCFLVAVEEFSRSLIPHAGPTMPWYAQCAFVTAGFTLSFLGDKGQQVWRWLRGQRTNVPRNASELVWCWGRMVTEAHNTGKAQGVHPARVLVGLAEFPTLRPYLSAKTKQMIDSAGTSSENSPMDSSLSSVLEDIERTARKWKLPSVPTQEITG
jgi:hypothetical protein